MKKPRKNHPKISHIGDHFGLWNFSWGSSLLGTQLMRHSYRVGLLAGAVVGTVNWGYNVAKGEEVPWYITGGTFFLLTALMAGTGATLKYGVPLLFHSKIAKAKANDLNLMEEYRKSLEDQHLGQLWEEVYKYEPFGDYEHEGIRSLDQLVTENEKRDSFLRSAKEALITPQSVERRYAQLGINLALFKNWRDAGNFEDGDTKLKEDYERNSIVDIRELTSTNWFDKYVLEVQRFYQKHWFTAVMNAVSRDVGIACDEFNEEYDSNRFTPQVFLWPGEEKLAWLEEYEGASEEVVRRRKEIIKKIFGKNFEIAKRKLSRMFDPDFEWATQLRVKFDAEYASGMLDYCPLSDLSHHGYDENMLLIDQMEKNKRKVRTIDAYLSEHYPRLFDNKLLLRTGRIMHHVDPTLALDETLPGRIEDNSPEYNRNLLDLRQLHTLTKITIQDYHTLIKTLGYSA